MKSDPVRHNRIVIAGKFPSYSTASGVAAGFRQLGWDVSEVDLERFAGEATSTFQKIKSRILSRRSVAEYNREIVRRVEEFGPAMFLTVKGSYISARTLQKIRSLGALAVNYYPDFRFSYKDVDESTFDYYDRFFTTKSFQVDYLAKRIGGGMLNFSIMDMSAKSIFLPLMQNISNTNVTFVTSAIIHRAKKSGCVR